MLTDLQTSPDRFAGIARQAAGRIGDLDGRGLVNMLAIAALTRTWDADLFAAALDERVLRRRTFAPPEQALLYHVHVALRTHAPHLHKGLPVDVAQACLKAQVAATSRLQGVYDVVALALNRLRLPYTYRHMQQRSGYLTWLLLPGPSAPRTLQQALEAAAATPTTTTPTVQAHAAAAAAAAASIERSLVPGSIAAQLAAQAPPTTPGVGRSTQPQISLEIDGEWNSIPGMPTGMSQLASSTTPPPLHSAAARGALALHAPPPSLMSHSLAHRLYVDNLWHVDGVKAVSITAEERARVLSSMAVKAMDTGGGSGGGAAGQRARWEGPSEYAKQRFSGFSGGMEYQNTAMHQARMHDAEQEAKRQGDATGRPNSREQGAGSSSSAGHAQDATASSDSSQYADAARRSSIDDEQYRDIDGTMVVKRRENAENLQQLVQHISLGLRRGWLQC